MDTDAEQVLIRVYPRPSVVVMFRKEILSWKSLISRCVPDRRYTESLRITLI